MTNDCFLILGGAGLVGRQIAIQVAKELEPAKVVIASLLQEESEPAADELAAQFPTIEWVSAWGNIFVRRELCDLPRQELTQTHDIRNMLFEDIYGDFDAAYERSHLVQLILEHRPAVIVDSINTATAISYQDLYSATAIARMELDVLVKAARHDDPAVVYGDWRPTQKAVEVLMLTQSLPQLTRHVLLLHRVMCEVGTRLYLKIGTTGTGGMGLNIPYTHSEDKPSSKLLTKSAVAFAHTGLLFLMARTPHSPIVKEIKPGAMIGYADITHCTIQERGRPVILYISQSEKLGGTLDLRQPPDDYGSLGELALPVVNTGENGLFTKGEFEAITALDQMEFMTPEEIAREAVLEIKGSNTGQDVIASINSSVMNPTYRAGYLRNQVLTEIAHLEETTRTHSVALGYLGPPELSKLLWEAELLKIAYGDLSPVLEHDPQTISDCLYQLVLGNEHLRASIISIGVPILAPDGITLIRGPYIRIPEIPGRTRVELTPPDIDVYAAKGWVDLRPSNFALWKTRFQTMAYEKARLRGRGSASVARETYLFEDIRIGEIVGWIFNNEMDAYRMGIK